MSFIGVIVALAVIGAILAVCIWILYYHYHNRRLGLTNQPFLPRLPNFLNFKKKTTSVPSGGRGVDLESGSRQYEGLGGDGDDAWDAREEYEGARLHTGPPARGFDGQDERRYDDDLDNPFGDGDKKNPAPNENPFGSGARRVEQGEGDIGRNKSPAPVSGSRRSLFNEDI
jgi:hypothetical protein